MKKGDKVWLTMTDDELSDLESDMQCDMQDGSITGAECDRFWLSINECLDRKTALVVVVAPCEPYNMVAVRLDKKGARKLRYEFEPRHLELIMKQPKVGDKVWVCLSLSRISDFESDLMNELHDRAITVREYNRTRKLVKKCIERKAPLRVAYTAKEGEVELAPLGGGKWNLPLVFEIEELESYDAETIKRVETGG